MAGTERPRSTDSNWAELRIIASVCAIGLTASALGIYATDRTESAVEPAALSRACQDVDHARVAHLVQVLERNRPDDAPVIERAIYALNIARRHCLYGWSDTAAEQYDWLNSWLNEHS